MDVNTLPPKSKLGTLCKRGHDHSGDGESWRYVRKNGTLADCIECTRINSNAYFQSNRGKCLEAARARKRAKRKGTKEEYYNRAWDKDGNRMCAGCKTAKPASEYYVLYKGTPREKVVSPCKECQKKAALERYHADPEKFCKAADAWRRANPDKTRERARRYAQENPEIVKAINRRTSLKYGRKYPEKRKAAARRSRAAKPEVYRLISMRRRARLQGAAGETKYQELKSRIAFYGFKCWVCGDDYKEIDHVKPVSKGGSNWPSNLRPICRRCNRKKTDRWPFSKEDFLREIEMDDLLIKSERQRV